MNEIALVTVLIRLFPVKAVCGKKSITDKVN